MAAEYAHAAWSCQCDRNTSPWDAKKIVHVTKKRHGSFEKRLVGRKKGEAKYPVIVDNTLPPPLSGEEEALQIEQKKAAEKAPEKKEKIMLYVSYLDDDCFIS